MNSPSRFAYVQTRIQSRYGSRAKTEVWLKLHTIDDLGSYLQVARQTQLRPWVLGINSTHSSHSVELALRQKYRQHVDEVARWMPSAWQGPVQWIKRLADLPLLQYLAAGGEPVKWMSSDPAINGFTMEDPALRLQAMRDAGCTKLVEAWQQDDLLIAGWLRHWNSLCPDIKAFKQGLQQMELLLHSHNHLSARQADTGLAAGYADLENRLRTIFRRYTFQPAAVCAYLASIAIDVQHVRSDLMQRMLFSAGDKETEAIAI
jgi:hypothetical protein